MKKKYQKDFEDRVKQDMNNSNYGEAIEFSKKIIYVKKLNNQRKDLKNGIKDFLYGTYKGYCQICGFTFIKVADNKKSFEMFNWDDERVVRTKKSFVSTADSLCLCRNCIANIKWGGFEPVFIDKINGINDFSHANMDDIKKVLHNIIDENTADIFREHLDFEDMYALEIKLNEVPKNIYFTNGHLIQFIAYLQMEE